MNKLSKALNNICGTIIVVLLFTGISFAAQAAQGSTFELEGRVDFIDPKVYELVVDDQNLVIDKGVMVKTAAGFTTTLSRVRKGQRIKAVVTRDKASFGIVHEIQILK